MTINVSDKLSDLTGDGVEYLTDKNGDVLAAFYNGNFQRISVTCNSEEATIPTVKE